MRASLVWSLATALMLTVFAGCRSGLSWPSMPSMSLARMNPWHRAKGSSVAPDQFAKRNVELPSAAARRSFDGDSYDREYQGSYANATSTPYGRGGSGERYDERTGGSYAQSGAYGGGQAPAYGGSSYDAGGYGAGNGEAIARTADARNSSTWGGSTAGQDRYQMGNQTDYGASTGAGYADRTLAGGGADRWNGGTGTAGEYRSPGGGYGGGSHNAYQGGGSTTADYSSGGSGGGSATPAEYRNETGSANAGEYPSNPSYNYKGGSYNGGTYNGGSYQGGSYQGGAGSYPGGSDAYQGGANGFNPPPAGGQPSTTYNGGATAGSLSSFDRKEPYTPGSTRTMSGGVVHSDVSGPDGSRVVNANGGQSDRYADGQYGGYGDATSSAGNWNQGNGAASDPYDERPQPFYSGGSPPYSTGGSTSGGAAYR